MSRSFPIIDIHAHFPIHNTLPTPSFDQEVLHPALSEYAADRQARMNLEWSTQPYEPPARTPAEVDANLTRWLAELDKHEVRFVNFVSANSNDQLAKIVAKHPQRFSGFAHHPLLPGAGVELRRAVDDLGLCGYKLLGPRTEISFDDDSVRDVWEFCAERGLPVLIHFGFLGRGGGVVSHPRMSPLSLFEVARAFPEIPFIIPHFGVNTWADVLALAWSLPNILVDTSGSNQWMRWMPYPLTLEDLFRKAYETLGPERIVFGTDSSAFPRGFSLRYLEDQLRACYTMNMHAEDIALIFGGNAARLLKLDF